MTSRRVTGVTKLRIISKETDACFTFSKTETFLNGVSLSLRLAHDQVQLILPYRRNVFFAEGAMIEIMTDPKTAADKDVLDTVFENLID